METFYSIQGEGFHTGKPAFFARIGGCDVGCRWCDTKDSWQAALHPVMAVEDIVKMALAHPARAVVVTGGEPLQYPMDLFCDAFKEAGFTLFLETSGAGTLSGKWDWICLSPKKNTPPQPSLMMLAHELKIVVYEPEDIEWALSLEHKVNPSCHLYLQPEWSRREIITPQVVQCILNNPQWKISQQTHKYLNIP